jgi:hypothetical protein
MLNAACRVCRDHECPLSPFCSVSHQQCLRRVPILERAQRWHVENHIQALSHTPVSNAILIRSDSFCRLHDVAIELISNRVSPREEKTSRMERPVSRQGLRLGFYPASDLPCEATEPIGCRFDPLLPSSTLAAEKTGAPQGFEQTIALCYGALRTCVITTCARLQGNHQCH